MKETYNKSGIKETYKTDYQKDCCKGVPAKGLSQVRLRKAPAARIK